MHWGLICSPLVCLFPDIRLQSKVTIHICIQFEKMEREVTRWKRCHIKKQCWTHWYLQYTQTHTHTHTKRGGPYTSRVFSAVVVVLPVVFERDRQLVAEGGGQSQQAGGGAGPGVQGGLQARRVRCERDGDGVAVGEVLSLELLLLNRTQEAVVRVCMQWCSRNTLSLYYWISVLYYLYFCRLSLLLYSILQRKRILFPWNLRYSLQNQISLESWVRRIMMISSS